MGELIWLIDLEPFPLTSGTASVSSQPRARLTCIGANDTGCLWATPRDYITYAGSDTNTYIPLGLTIRAQNITRMFQFGHASLAGQILRQLRSLSISCDDPVPIFAPYALEPLVMALAAASMDFGFNPTAGAAASLAPPPPPPPSAAAASAPPGNTTSDAAYNASMLLLAYSRLYMQPILGSPLLRSLSIRDCALTGQLPPASFWLQLPALERLDLSRNQLSGPLPATFGPAPPLSYVNLSHNRISGPLTASLVRYGGCGRTLDLSYNDLRGGLPNAWLDSACTLYGKSAVGLTAARRRRRRWLLGQAAAEEVRQQEPGPEGGMAKVSSSAYLSYKRAQKTITAVPEATAPSSNSMASSGTPTLSATASDSYPFWLSYPMSYMYGGDGCPMLGVAWKESIAAHVRNGTAAAVAAAAGEPPAFNFTVLLYGNLHLETPGTVHTGYAAAASEHLIFAIRENACTIYEPLPELLWVWGSFGAAALTVLLAALLHALLAVRRARQKVAPSAAAAAGGAKKKGHHRSRSEARHSREATAAGGGPAAAAAGSAGGAAARGEEGAGERLGTSSEASVLGGAASPAAVAVVAASGGGGGGGGGGGAAAAAQAGVDATGEAPARGSGRGNTSGSSGGGGSGGGGGNGGGQEGDAAAARAPAATDTVGADTGGDGGNGGGRGMARLIIVAHARRYSARAVRRLSLYGNALADALEALGAWLLYDIPWGPVARALVFVAVHLGAAGLTYVLALPQRTEYCKTVRPCGPYLYVVPAVLSALSIGLTVFLMRATRELAWSMASKVAAGKPESPGSLDASLQDGPPSGSPSPPPPPPFGEAGSGARQWNVDGQLGSGEEAAAVAGGGCAGAWDGCYGEEPGGGGPGAGGKGVPGSRTATGSGSGDETEARPTPPPSVVAAPVAAAAAAAAPGEAWVSGLQPRSAQSGGMLTPPGSAGTQPFPGLAAVAGSLPVYDADPLPMPGRMGGGTSRSSSTTGLRAAPPSVARGGVHCGGSPSRFGPSGSGSGGGGGSAIGSPVRPSVEYAAGPSFRGGDGSPRSDVDGGRRGGGGGGGGVWGVGAGLGPVAEALEADGDAAATTATATPGREQRGRGSSGGGGGLFGWFHGNPISVPLFPASPYGNYQPHFGHAVAAAATRARASLESSFRSAAKTGLRLGSGSGTGSGQEAAGGGAAGRSAGRERPGGDATEAHASSDASAATAAGADGQTRKREHSAEGPGPLAEAEEEDAGASGSAHSGGASSRALPLASSSSRSLRPPSLGRGPGDGWAVGDGLECPPSGNQLAGAVLERSDGGGGGDDDDVNGSGAGVAVGSEDDGRAAQRRASHRGRPRPDPVLTNLYGNSGSGSPTAAATSSAAAFPTSTGGGGGGYAGSAPLPYSAVEPLAPAQGRSLANSASTSTHGSRISRVAVDSVSNVAAGGWLCAPSEPTAAAGGFISGVTQPTDPRVAVAPSLPLLTPDSPASTGPSRPGGPWLEDRLAALATLSSATGGGAAAAVSSAVAPRMPSVATAAAVAAATPRRHGGGSGGGKGRPAAAAPQTLQPEALRVVNQYLRDYATGKKGAGWRARGGRTAASVCVVLLVFAPLSPLAALLALAAALVVVTHAAARGAAAVAAATRRCYGLLRRRQPPPPRQDGGEAAAAAPAGGAAAGWLSRQAASLRLSGGLVLALHLHVAGWLLCVPLAIFAGVLYGLGYVWGRDAVPLPWVFLAVNCACLAGVMLLLVELVTQMPAWEQGVCRYPYVVVLQTAATAAAPAAAPAPAVEAMPAVAWTEAGRRG